MTGKPIKLLLFSLLPALFLLVAAEAAVRLLGLDEPSHHIPALGRDFFTHIRTDRDLGWSMKPDAEAVGQGNVTIRTNSLGLRSPEVKAKEPGEYRILSLGESTTYGVGVEGSETYSFQLQERLNALEGGRRFTVINAGHSAYSSTQSLRYLKLRGLGLEPDMVLFYHEVNDYLPTIIRLTEMDEVGIQKTDRQLYDSRLNAVGSFFLEHWGLYRYLVFSGNRRRMEQVKEGGKGNPLDSIGLPGLQTLRERNYAEKLQVDGFGRRVSEEERRANLAELSSLCRERGIDLVLLHPSYKYSNDHRCVLTEFSAAQSIPVFKTHDILHPPGLPRGSLFIDLWHPSREGHRRIADGLAPLVLSRAR